MKEHKKIKGMVEMAKHHEKIAKHHSQAADHHDGMAKHHMGLAKAHKLAKVSYPTAKSTEPKMAKSKASKGLKHETMHAEGKKGRGRPKKAVGGY